MLRVTDFACRFGGDEFVVVLPNTVYDQAIQLAENIHERFKEELIRFTADGVSVSASMGVIAIIPEDRSYEDSIKRADQALYQAKNGGRNRVVSA